MHLHISYIMDFLIEINTKYYSLMILVILEAETCK